MGLKYVNGKDMKENKSNLLDQYFTKRTISLDLYKKTREIISKYEKNIDDYIWLEPSVGEGCFFDHLPNDKKIGIDIEPKRNDVIKHDYLTYELPKEKLIVIGNPPFGHRGVLALEFINHSVDAEYVAFILPMFFKSTGKGSIKYRVKGFNLIYECDLPKNSFYLENGKDVDVKCCFQIWSKNHKHDNLEFSWYNNKTEPFSGLLKVVTVSLAKKRECGKEWIFDKKANWYLSSSYFKDNKVSKNFDDVNYKSGVAIIYNENNSSEINNKLDSIFVSTNWNEYASLATNGCYHIGKSNIYKLLNDKIREIYMDVNDIMEDVINKKYEELNNEEIKNDRFIKIKSFEGNAIGQIGENFVKAVFRNYGIPMDELGKEVVHDEYDVISGGLKIEVKTARKGAKVNNFQFNGINPIYNHDYIFLIGITTDKVFYKIISGKCTYNHSTRSNYLEVNGKLRKLVPMNPGNSVNYKLTLPLKELDAIDGFVAELKKLFC